jgi:hypothetical protein
MICFPAVGATDRPRLVVEQYQNLLLINGHFGKAETVVLDPELTGDAASALMNVAAVCSSRLSWNSSVEDMLDAAKIMGWTIKHFRTAMNHATANETSFNSVWAWITAKLNGDVDFLGSIVLYALPATKQAAQQFADSVAGAEPAWDSWKAIFRFEISRIQL